MPATLSWLRQAAQYGAPDPAALPGRRRTDKAFARCGPARLTANLDGVRPRRVAGAEEDFVHPVIQTAIASQRISDLRAEAARTAQARVARQARSPRFAWLFDLADRRETARLAQDGPDLCCPDHLLTGQCAVHTGAHRMATGSSGRP